jgi:hypothetical protein
MGVGSAHGPLEPRALGPPPVSGQASCGDLLTALLALVAPDGARTALLIEGGSAAVVGSPQARARSADLVVVRAAALDALRPGWRRRVASQVHELLAPDGVAYVLSPGPSRALIRRAVGRRDLRSAGALLHLPRARRTQLLVPLTASEGARLRAHAPGPLSRRRRALGRALRLRPARVALTMLLPDVGLVMRRPGARSCFSWLYEAAGGPEPAPLATIAVSWRGLGAGATVTGWSPGAWEGVVVAKVALDSNNSLAAEHASLVDMGAAAREAGAGVPRSHGLRRVGPWRALIESHVPGRPADALLRRDAGRTLPLLIEITRWLARWHRATASVEPLGEAGVTAFLLGPLATLDGLLGDEAYRRWVTALAARIQGRPVPLVAAHNDLTMANVVWSDRHGLGVLDWATAAPDRLPLMDFFYAVVDAVHAAQGGSRVQAFEASFEHGGRYHSSVKRLRGELAQAVAVDPDLVAAAFHACFLHHAVNEQRADPTQAGPFLELVRRAGRMTAGEGLG